jgi:hypothetical protein
MRKTCYNNTAMHEVFYKGSGHAMRVTTDIRTYYGPGSTKGPVML